MIVVTGGAGFIGSNLIAGLEARGEDDIVCCDRLRDGQKWRNIAKRALADIVPPENLIQHISSHSSRVAAVFHMGAISATTETDGDLVIRTNFTFSTELWKVCAKFGIPLIYASSAAVYGDGKTGFDDDNDFGSLRALRPLNLYGWSKWLFDCWVIKSIERGEAAPPVWTGLRFFNVYGPNEYHKGAMQSLVSKIIVGHKPGAPASLFKSYQDGVDHGQQMRDFVYVDDVVEVCIWLQKLNRSAGILNLGTGVARSFRDLAAATIEATGETPKLEYIEMPTALRSAYQYFTQARMDRLRALGYNLEFTSLENGVTAYVKDYLLAGDPYR